jgi:hypothetical protein
LFEPTLQTTHDVLHVTAVKDPASLEAIISRHPRWNA